MFGKPVEGTLLTTTENAPKLHPDVFNLPLSIDVVMGADQEKEEVEETDNIEEQKRVHDTEAETEEENAQPGVNSKSDGDAK